MRRYVFRLALIALGALAPSVATADDQQIAQQILQKLKAEKDAGTLKGFSIDLQVDEGTVWLSGRVATEQQKARALDLARRISGVQQVVDDLSVSSPPTRPVIASHPAGTGKPGVVMTPPPPVAVAAPAMPVALPPPVVTEAPPAIGMPMTNPYALAGVPTPASASPSPAYQEPAEAPSASSGAASVEAVPMEADQPSVAARSTRRSSSSANSSVLNNISKSLMTAVHGRQPDEESASGVQPASGSQDVAASGGPVGSGVDPTYASSRRSVVQAAQPVANLPGVVTADSLQPVASGGHVAMVPMQVPYMVPVYAGSQMQVPLAMGPARTVNYNQMGGPVAGGAPVPMYMPGSGVGIAPARYDHPAMPGYAWPSYAAYPNYAAVTYPKQYSPTAWPYIGPFYPYPQVPLGWRKVTLEWDDGWWFLDFKDRRTMYNH